jgi:hypothetical protein
VPSTRPRPRAVRYRDEDQQRPAENTPVLRCTCGAVYHDEPLGRKAHRTVFGHDPRNRPKQAGDG